MIDNFDKKIMKLAQKEADRTPKLPQNFDEHIENILSCLPAGKKRRFTWKKVIILAAALAATLSVTVTAAVNYVRQRMEAMNEAERSSHFQASLNTAPADFYSRELTDMEKNKMEELKEKYYNEGVFPEGTLKRIEAASEYDGNGVAFLASRGTFFLPEKELNDEEILQIIDFREKREFSIHEAESKAAAGELDDSAYDAIYEPVQLELTAQDQIINYSGEMRIDAAAAFGNTLYIGERSNKANGSQACLYQLELGSDKPVKMEVQVPDGMDISMMTCDGKGNLCLLLTQSENGSFENVRSCLWKLSPEGEELEKADINQISGTKMPYQAIAADKDGRIYLAEWKGAKKSQRILVLNEDCTLAGSITCDDGDVRGLGRARNGEVYGVLMAGHEWIPTIVGFDIQNFTIDEKYSNVLPDDVGAFDTMGAGTDSDLLIWGPYGIYTYNIGDQKAVATRAQYELPNGAAMCFTPGSRALFISNNYTVKDGIMDFDNYSLEKIYLMKAE